MKTLLQESSTAAVSGREGALSGLGGWLIAAQIMLWWSLIGSIVYLGGRLTPLLNGTSVFNVESAAIHDDGIRRLILTELAGNMAIIVFTAVVLVLLYRRSRAFVPLVLAYWGFVLLMSLVSFGLSLAVAQLAASVTLYVKLAQNLVFCGVWLFYFRRSIRVRNTFVN